MLDDFKMKLLFNSLMPLVEKMVKSGELEKLIRAFKKEYALKLWQGEAVELLITTEQNDVEYVHVVALSEDLKLRVLESMKMSELVHLIITKIKK